MIGTRIDRYEVLAKLGEGGMAVVYRARDTRLGSEVAIKVIRTEKLPPDTLERTFRRFEREARLLAALTHPYIVKVSDYGEVDGRPYLVMPYLPGGTLKERLGKPMGWQAAVRLLLPVAGALAYAHAHGAIHRDVKPGNILLTEEGQPLLTDFGIARIFEIEAGQTLTGTGVGMGTPGYMAPEQWRGESGPQSDVYSLGVVLYELVTGRKPYQADTPADLLLKQATEPLPNPRQFVPDLPVAVEGVLVRALARGAGERYPDMRAFAVALEGLLGGQQAAAVPAPRAMPIDTQDTIDQGALPSAPIPAPVSSRLPSPPEPVLRPAGQGVRKWLLGGAGVLVVAVVLIVALAVLPRLVAGPTATATASDTSTVLPSAPPTAVSLPVELVDERGVKMGLVPGGPFTMGSDSNYVDEKPAHEVALDAFYMDIYEVTNSQYVLFLNEEGNQSEGGVTWLNASSPYVRIEQGAGKWGAVFGYAEHPVTNVTWYGARAYCEWRGGRLPTEAEWEKAARGTDGRRYPWWGGVDSTYANYNKNIGDTTKVGRYPQGVSPYGMYDMAGNVWEWVSDWYDAYPGNTISNSDYGTSYRVLRGGSWGNNEDSVRSSYRYWYGPAYSDLNLGFRCARSP